MRSHVLRSAACVALFACERTESGARERFRPPGSTVTAEATGAAPPGAPSEVPSAPSAVIASEPASPPPSSSSVAPVVPDGPAVVLDPVLGWRELPRDGLTRPAMERKLGPADEVIEHGTYSTTLRYARGIEATYCAGDPLRRIRWIEFRPPFRAELPSRDGRDRIVLGKTTMREARRQRGPCSWTTTDTAPTWSCSYKVGNGETELSLFVERDTSVPRFPLDEERHLDRIIIAIELSDASGC